MHVRHLYRTSLTVSGYKHACDVDSFTQTSTKLQIPSSQSTSPFSPFLLFGPAALHLEPYSKLGRLELAATGTPDARCASFNEAEWQHDTQHNKRGRTSSRKEAKSLHRNAVSCFIRYLVGVPYRALWSIAMISIKLTNKRTLLVLLLLHLSTSPNFYAPATLILH